MPDIFDWNGYAARWVCAGDGLRVLWVSDPGDGGTSPSCEPVGEDTCTCERCAPLAVKAAKKGT